MSFVRSKYRQGYTCSYKTFLFFLFVLTLFNLLRLLFLYLFAFALCRSIFRYLSVFDCFLKFFAIPASSVRGFCVNITHPFYFRSEYFGLFEREMSRTGCCFLCCTQNNSASGCKMLSVSAACLFYFYSVLVYIHSDKSQGFWQESKDFVPKSIKIEKHYQERKKTLMA